MLSRSPEEDRFLEGDPDLGPKGVEVHLPDVHPVEGDAPARNVVEAWDEVDEG